MFAAESTTTYGWRGSIGTAARKRVRGDGRRRGLCVCPEPTHGLRAMCGVGKKCVSEEGKKIKG